MARPNSLRSARSAGLRYVCDDGRGIRRVKCSAGFRYIGPDGKIVRNASVLKRIRALVIPPAWTDVWISTDPHGHLQATGRDARGRKQYRYHPRWREWRDQTKFDRMHAFAAALPAIRAKVNADLANPGLCRDKVLASVVQLLERTLIRVGNEEYARDNRSFGLTTLRDHHVEVTGPTLRFQFRGKSGKRHEVGLDDRRLARIVRRCRDLPGQELFQYIDNAGRCRSVSSMDVNAYLKAITGEDVTAKYFRTWSATVLACTSLRSFKPARSRAESKRNVLLTIDAVAGMLGNTRGVCKRAYIHPSIIDAYESGSMASQRVQRFQTKSRRDHGLREDELVTLAVLRLVGRSGEQAAA